MNIYSLGYCVFQQSWVTVYELCAASKETSCKCKSFLIAKITMPQSCFITFEKRSTVAQKSFGHKHSLQNDQKIWIIPKFIYNAKLILHFL